MALCSQPSKRRRLYKEIADAAEECKDEVDDLIVDCLYPDSDAENEDGDEDGDSGEDGVPAETRELRALLGLYLLGEKAHAVK